MMATNEHYMPPAPVGAKPDSVAWVEWYRKLREVAELGNKAYDDLETVVAPGLADKLNKNAADVLGGTITFNEMGAFKVGNVTWNGATVTGTGTMFTQYGIVGALNNTATFVLKNDGTATFGGVLTAATGTFAGALSVGGSDTTSFHVDTSGNMWLGGATYANSAFKVSSAGAVTVAAKGYICSSGKNSYGSTTAGFFLGYDSTAYKLNIGNSSSYMTWDGSALSLHGGSLTAGTGSYLGYAFRVTSSGVLYCDNINGSRGTFIDATTGGALNSSNTSFGPGGDFRGSSGHGATASSSVNGSGAYMGCGNKLAFDFYAAGKGTYGPFTGSHDALVQKENKIELGDIVCDLGVLAKKGVSDAITLVTPCTKLNQKTAVGILNTEPTQLGMQLASMSEEQYLELKEQYLYTGINSVGEGLVNVCGLTGDIEAGDLITTSTIVGKGCKQADDIVHNYTVAKARESVSFTSPTEVKCIACIYLCG